MSEFIVSATLLTAMGSIVLALVGMFLPPPPKYRPADQDEEFRRLTEDCRLSPEDAEEVMRPRGT